MKTDNTKSEIIWKGFRLGNLFEWSGKHKISKTSKEYSTLDHYQEGYVANITAGKYNEGIANFILEDDEISNKKRIDALTIVSDGDGGSGTCFFHDYYFVSTGSNALLENKYYKLQEIFDTDHIIPRFFAKLITKMFMNGIYSRAYKVSKEVFNRELILLPCLEVSQDDEYIWEENGRYYTLAVDYIKQLMEKAKERKEARTIRMYEAERAKYEAERAKYEAGYNAEKPKVLWKGFRLGNLFELINGRDSSIAQKNLHKSSVKTDEFSVSIVTESKLNNGIGFYLKNDDPIVKNKMQRGLTFGTQFGNCNFHNYDYFIIGNLNYLNFKNDYLYSLCNDFVCNYFAKLISHIFQKSNLFGYGNKIDQIAFYREIILLPCLEVSQDDEYIWEENGRYYTLATNYISYLYLTGRMNKYQKLIDTYTYTY